MYSTPGARYPQVAVLSFIFGDVGGIYWGLIFFVRTVLPLTGLALVSFVGALVAWLIGVNQRKPGVRRLGMVAGALLLTRMRSSTLFGQRAN